MYEDLVKQLRSESCVPYTTLKTMREAADAIESLLNYEALYRDLTDKGLKTIRELLDKYPKWIFAEERLPKKPGMYLVWIHEPTDLGKDDWMAEYNYGYVDLLQYDAEQGLWQNEPYEAYNAHLEFVDKVNGFYVSHWMEKPMPPKEERKDPCADCVHYPPSSTDGKPCCACDPANPLTNCHEVKEKT